MLNTDITKSAIDDYLAISWRHHAKRSMPSSLIGKQVAGEDLVELADNACLAIDVLLSEVSIVSDFENTSKKPLLLRTWEDRKRKELWTGRNELIARLDTVMAMLNKEEWYYFWGLHQILDLLPQTLEER